MKPWLLCSGVLALLGPMSGKANADLYSPDAVVTAPGYTDYHFTITNLPFLEMNGFRSDTFNTLLLPQSDSSRALGAIIVSFQGQAFGEYSWFNHGDQSEVVSASLTTGMRLPDIPGFTSQTVGASSSQQFNAFSVPPNFEVQDNGTLASYLSVAALASTSDVSAYIGTGSLGLTIEGDLVFRAPGDGYSAGLTSLTGTIEYVYLPEPSTLLIASFSILLTLGWGVPRHARLPRG